MNNKVVINTYLATVEPKINEANRKNRDRVMDTKSILMVARWEGA